MTPPFLVSGMPPGPTRIAAPACLLIGFLSLAVTSRPTAAQFAPVAWITQDTLARDWWPRVSPDGRTVTFSRSRDGGATFELMRTTIAGDSVRPFFARPPEGSATRGDWSKRHARFAFTLRRREDVDSAAVWIADARGTRAELLPLRWPSPSMLYPTWSPDERALLAQDWGSANGPSLVEMDLRTGAVARLTDPAKIFAAGLTLSPDGRWIAFVGQRNEGQRYDQMQNRLWLMRRRGGAEPREIGRGQARQPDWSPDGHWIAFTSTRGDSARRQAVFVVSPEDGEPVQLTEHALDARHAVWSPDGRWLVFSALVPGSTQAYGLAKIRVPLLHSRRRAPPG